MKNLKKLLTVLLVGVLLAASCIPIWAAVDSTSVTNRLIGDNFSFYPGQKTEAIAVKDDDRFKEFRLTIGYGENPSLIIDFESCFFETVEIPLFWMDQEEIVEPSEGSPVYAMTKIALYTINTSGKISLKNSNGNNAYLYLPFPLFYSQKENCWEHFPVVFSLGTVDGTAVLYGDVGPVDAAHEQLPEGYPKEQYGQFFSSSDRFFSSNTLFNPHFSTKNENGDRVLAYFRFVTDDTIIERPIVETPAAPETPAVPETPAPAAPAAQPVVEEPVTEAPAEDPEANLIDPAGPQLDPYTLLDPAGPELDPFTLLDPVGALLEPFTVLNP